MFIHLIWAWCWLIFGLAIGKFAPLSRLIVGHWSSLRAETLFQPVYAPTTVSRAMQGVGAYTYLLKRWIIQHPLPFQFNHSISKMATLLVSCSTGELINSLKLENVLKFHSTLEAPKNINMCNKGIIITSLTHKWQIIHFNVFVLNMLNKFARSNALLAYFY